MLEELKEQVYEANLQLVAEGLVVQTFGNLSGIDRESGHMVIKPSGVAYQALSPQQMVAVSLDTGEPTQGGLNPSSDTPSHLVLYRAFSSVSAIVHTHSPYATAWSQARRPIPALGTTHADFFHGPVPCTRPLTEQEIVEAYEENTGHVIVETVKDIDPLSMPAALVACHAPFVWGADVAEAVKNAVALEYVARLATLTVGLKPDIEGIPEALQNKHFLRKHGPDAYYGQDA